MSTQKTSSDVMISFEGVCKSYGGLNALHTTDLAVKRGEFLSLLGPSGSGKSTILNIVAGAIQPSAGRLLIDGENVLSKPSRERGLGMVFQNYALLPHLNVFENIAFPLKIRGFSKAEITQKVGSALERVGLLGFEQRKPKEMSGGQQQRVGIARCIVYSPSIILMDEPLGALDKKLREQLQSEIKKIHRDLGTTLVYVTHDQEEALNLSDRICLMNGGRIAQHGTPDELYFDPCNEFVADFVGESNIIPCTVINDHTLRAADSTYFTVSKAKLAGCPVGDSVKLMIRPEKIAVCKPGEPEQVRDNEITGQVKQISFIGGMTRYDLQTSSGLKLIVKDISNRQADRASMDNTLRVKWLSSDCSILK